VNFYKVVRDRPKELINVAGRLALKTEESDFYRVRSSKPTSQVGRAARLLYLNRLCFNGLYRVNSKGVFNVPFGNYKNPTVVNTRQIEACSSVLRFANIRAAHFSEVLRKAVSGDLVYFDPPYVPLTPTASFASYSKEGFNESDQRQLASVVSDLTERGVRVILSNSDTPLSREIFASLNLYSISASRAISASARSRIKVKELVAVNFPVSQMTNPGVVQKFRVG
jgi:DNA adenine methylase